MHRLMHGCDRIKIQRPDQSVLRNEALPLCKKIKEGVLKIIITRGAGGRGYAQTRDLSSTRVMAIFPLPEYSPDFWRKGVAIRMCQTRLSMNPDLAGIKHLNRLEQVMARSEWDTPEFQEGLMMDMENNIVEGTMSNVFCVLDNNLFTPGLTRCGINGIIRERIISVAKKNNISVKEVNISFDQLCEASEIFLTNSLIGIWPVCRMEKQKYTIGPFAHRMKELLFMNEDTWE